MRAAGTELEPSGPVVDGEWSMRCRCAVARTTSNRRAPARRSCGPVAAVAATGFVAGAATAAVLGRQRGRRRRRRARRVPRHGGAPSARRRRHRRSRRRSHPQRARATGSDAAADRRSSCERRVELAAALAAATAARRRRRSHARCAAACSSACCTSRIGLCSCARSCAALRASRCSAPGVPPAGRARWRWRACASRSALDDDLAPFHRRHRDDPLIGALVRRRAVAAPAAPSRSPSRRSPGRSASS